MSIHMYGEWDSCQLKKFLTISLQYGVFEKMYIHLLLINKIN